MTDPADDMRAYFNPDGSPRPWTQCAHKWRLFFGPAMRCTVCGAGTICNTGDAKPQPVEMPLSVLRELAGIS